MKHKDLDQLGLSKETMDELDVDHVPMIVSDEFKKRGGSYRDRAIDRLIKLNMRFHSESNTLTTFAKRFLKMVCPYCTCEMLMGNWGGGLTSTTVEFNCTQPYCHGKAHITLDSNAIRVIPPKQPKSEE